MLVLELGRKERVDQLAFAPDGRALATTGNTGVAVWPVLADGRRADLLSGPLFCWKVQFSADGQFLFVSTAGSVWRFDRRTGTGTVAPLWHGTSPQFEVSPTGPFVLLSQYGSLGTRLSVCRQDELTDAGEWWHQMVEASGGHGLQFLPGGERFVRIRYDGWIAARNRHEYAVLICDAATGATVATSPAAPGLPFDLRVAPDGRRFACRESNHIDLHPLSAAAGPKVGRLKNDGRKHFTGFAFHPGGRLLAATSNDHTVKLYDLDTLELARTFTWQLGRMRSIAFGPDGTLAAAGTDKGQVIVWDVDV